MENVVSIEEIDEWNQKAWDIRISQLKECINISNNALASASVIQYEKGIADAERNLGYCFWRMSDYDSSLQHTLKAIDLYQKLNDKKGTADALNNLGAVYMFQKQHHKRLEINLECLKIRTEIDDSDGISSSMNNIGETYMEMNDFNNAQLWFEKCIQYPYSSKSSLAWANFNLGKLYFITHQRNKALEYLLKSVQLAESLSYHSLLTEIYYYLAKYYFSENEYNKSILYSIKSYKSAKQIDNKEGMALSALSLSEIYEQQNDFRKSLKYYKKYNLLKEQFLNEANLKTIQQLEMQYEINNLKRTAEIQKLQNEILLSSYQKIEFEHKELFNLFNTLRENISYAQNIQKNLIKIPEKFIQQYPYHFLIYQPMMMISGDFIWAHVSDDNKYYYFALGDCEGHGVSAALISMLCLSYLNNSVKNISDPKDIVLSLYAQINSLEQLNISEDYSNKITFDIILIKIDVSKQTIDYYSSGIEGLLIKKNNQEFFILNNDNISSPIHIHTDDILYIYSDGIYDQFGGEKGIRLKRKNWREYLLSIARYPMYSHKNIILDFLNHWKNKEKQTDDITIFGMQF
ncbi:MAG: tetratricopeptide repeat protein [Bacteroidota bacterium]